MCGIYSSSYSLASLSSTSNNFRNVIDFLLSKSASINFSYKSFKSFNAVLSVLKILISAISSISVNFKYKFAGVIVFIFTLLIASRTLINGATSISSSIVTVSVNGFLTFLIYVFCCFFALFLYFFCFSSFNFSSLIPL